VRKSGNDRQNGSDDYEERMKRRRTIVDRPRLFRRDIVVDSLDSVWSVCSK
jgi:hypothetical protein